MSDHSEKLMTLISEITGQKAVSCGISINKGWFPLVECLLGDIQHSLKYHHDSIGTKYGKDAGKIEFSVGLRFYADIGWNSDSVKDAAKASYISGMIAFAESMSCRLCEQCGSPSSPQPEGSSRMVTLCEKHHEERAKWRESKKGIF